MQQDDREKIIRHKPIERVNHWAVVICFLFTAISGLGFFFPSLNWFMNILGTPQLSRLLHPFTGVVMFLLFFPKMRWAIVRTRRPLLQLLRALSLLSISVLFIGGLRYIPLGEATAVMFLAPLIVTVLSAVFLHEKITKGQWLAVSVGFFGSSLSVIVTLSPRSAKMPRAFSS